MRAVAAIGLLALIGASARAEDAPTAPTPSARHEWATIDYPEVACPWGGGKASFSIGFADKKKLRFDINYTGAGWIDERSVEQAKRERSARPDEIDVRLHLSRGDVVTPTSTMYDPVGFSTNGSYASHDLMTFFAWPANDFSEAWLEVRIPQHVYWVEIPYGFARDPALPLCPAEPSRGAPQRPAAMKGLEKPEVVRWKRVHYDLGAIGGGVRVNLYLSNPFDAEADVELYKEDFLNGGKGWDLHTPKTSLKYAPPDAHLAGECVNVRKHDDFLRRSDTFKFNRYPADGRSWGTLIVRVGDVERRVIVPSSLFKYVHGHVRDE